MKLVFPPIPPNLGGIKILVFDGMRGMSVSFHSLLLNFQIREMTFHSF
jgi:hypothetical protein